MAPSTRLVATLLFGSGLAALVYQTAWQRMFRLIFGASTGASAAVLALFLGGLGLGGFLLGRRAERSPKPLLFYGNLEVGVAISAALTPLIADLCATFYFSLGGSRVLGLGGASVVRVLLAAAVMGVPVFLMGGTLPAAARAVEQAADAARGRLALLYAVNTFGAVVGALLGTLLLFEVFGTRLALWTAVLINLLVAIYARASGRKAPAIAVETTPDKNVDEDDAAKEPRARGQDRGRAPAAVVYGAAAVFGFAFLYLELVWYRMLAPILGGSTFTFGLILAVALAGIGIGGYWYSRRDESRPATLSLLSATAGLEAFFVALPLALGDRVAIFAAHARAVPGTTFGSLIAGWTLIAALVVLPAAIVAGYQFPVLFALIGRGREGVAKQVGYIYAYNTIGSIAGSLVGGIVLIPAIGAVPSWRLVAGLLVAVCLVSAVLAIRADASRGRQSRLIACAASIVSVLFLLADGPSSVWRHAPIGAGRAGISGTQRNALKAWMRGLQNAIIWERDGIESAVALDALDSTSFLVNGKSDGSTFGDRGTMILSTVLPAYLHGNPKSAYVIGLGLGLSAGWIAKVPSVERVDVAELEPAILDVARAVSDANFDVLNLPNVHLFEGDGREFMLTTDTKYDVIMSEPSNPYRAGVASLFTRDFYEVAERHLNEGGFFAQWVQAYEVSASTLKIVARTLRSVFPHVEAWATQQGDFLFLASREARTYDVQALRSRIREEPFRSAFLFGWLVEDVEGVFSHHIAGADVIAKIADDASVAVNTDDRNVLEYAFARSVGRQGRDLVHELHVFSVLHRRPYPSLSGPVDWRRLEEQRARIWRKLGSGFPSLPGQTANARLRAQAVGDGCRGALDGVAMRWEEGKGGEARDLVQKFALGVAYAEGEHQPKALEYAAALESEGLIAEAEVIRARAFLGNERRSDALAALERGISDLRKRALPLCQSALQTVDLVMSAAGEDPELIRRAVGMLLGPPLSVNQQRRKQVRTAQRLAFKLESDVDLCLEAMGEQIERPWWELWFLAGRYKCLTAAAHPLAEQAEADLTDFLEHEPDSYTGELLMMPKGPGEMAGWVRRQVGAPPPRVVQPPTLDAGARVAPAEGGVDGGEPDAADAARD